MRKLFLSLGLVLVISGVVVVALGAMAQSEDPVVALGWLLTVPLLVSVCGCAFLIASLFGIDGSDSRLARHRPLVLVALVGLALGLSFPVAGIISQIPDSLAGLNAEFVPGPAPAIGAIAFAVIGLAVGLAVGAIGSILMRIAYRVSSRLGTGAARTSIGARGYDVRLESPSATEPRSVADRLMTVER